MADEERSRREVRVLPAVIGAGIALAIAVGVVAYAAGHYGERTKTVTVQAAGPTTGTPTFAKVSPQVAAGAHTFNQFACAQCHGLQGQGGVDPAVPALKTVGHSLTVAQLTHIINHGLGESANPKQPYMPVWGDVISKTQVSDLVAYIRAGLPAVADAQPVSVPAGQGAAVARTLPNGIRPRAATRGLSPVPRPDGSPIQTTKRAQGTGVPADTAPATRSQDSNPRARSSLLASPVGCYVTTNRGQGYSPLNTGGDREGPGRPPGGC